VELKNILVWRGEGVTEISWRLALYPVYQGFVYEMYRELFDLSGKKALVIGAASGIGRAIAEGLREFGAYVIAADINYEGLKGVGDEARYVDITSRESIREMLKGIDKLDILVITPGINIRKRILEYSDDELMKIFSVNMIGHFYAVQEAAKIMIKSGGGSIILISSIRAVLVEPGQGPYSMTKAALIQLVKTLAAELAKYNIRVNALAPGIVETPLTEPIRKNPKWSKAYVEKTALKRWAKPSEMVGPAILLASDAGSYMTGTVVFADGGWTAIDGRYDPFEK